MLVDRQIETLCYDCRGSGARLYGGGGLWRSGMQTAKMTYGVCSSCWGSGDTKNPWLNLREAEEQRESLVRDEAAALMASSLGLGLRTLRYAQLELAGHLDAVRRKRATSSALDALCASLAGLLREMAGNIG